MKVSISNDGACKDEFHVAAWWTADWTSVLAVLRKQLAAAASVWPALGRYEIVEKVTKK